MRSLSNLIEKPLKSMASRPNNNTQPSNFSIHSEWCEKQLRNTNHAHTHTRAKLSNTVDIEFSENAKKITPELIMVNLLLLKKFWYVLVLFYFAYFTSHSLPFFLRIVGMSRRFFSNLLVYIWQIVKVIHSGDLFVVHFWMMLWLCVRLWSFRFSFAGFYFDGWTNWWCGTHARNQSNFEQYTHTHNKRNNDTYNFGWRAFGEP